MKAVVITLDAELAVGFNGVTYEQAGRADLHGGLDERAEKAREAWRWLVDRFGAYDVPCTWAVVGHLYLEACGGSHPDHPADAERFGGDPGGDATTAPGWFGRDLIRAVDESPVAHEIGSHTFSHVELGDERTTDAVARWELDQCRAVADAWGHSLDSFVFPRDSVGHRDHLADIGFAAYRGSPPARWYDDSPLRPVGKALAYTVGRTPPPIGVPVVDEYGLVNVPGSMHLFGFEGAARRAVETVATDPVVRQVRLGLAALAERDEGVFHLWLHPNEVLADADADRIERVLALVDRFRSDHDVPVRTMGDVAAATRAAAPPAAGD